MKVVCINNVELCRDPYGKPRHNILPLTIGKVYDTYTSLDSLIKFYIIEKDNNDETTNYAANHFVTLDVWREMQLNKIL